jgi:hypothetical protein
LTDKQKQIQGETIKTIIRIIINVDWLPKIGNQEKNIENDKFKGKQQEQMEGQLRTLIEYQSKKIKGNNKSTHGQWNLINNGEKWHYNQCIFGNQDQGRWCNVTIESWILLKDFHKFILIFAIWLDVLLMKQKLVPKMMNLWNISRWM